MSTALLLFILDPFVLFIHICVYVCFLFVFVFVVAFVFVPTSEKAMGISRLDEALGLCCRTIPTVFSYSKENCKDKRTFPPAALGNFYSSVGWFL